MTWRPIGNHLIVEIDPPREMVGSIFIPEKNHMEKPTWATVLAVGTGKRGKDGIRRPIEGIEVGDRVCVTPWAFRVGWCSQKLPNRPPRERIVLSDEVLAVEKPGAPSLS